MPLPPLVKSLAASPRDMGRWAFWVPFRNALDPHRPQDLRRLWPLWRVLYRAGGPQKERMREEYRKILGISASEAELEQVVKSAYRVAFRAHLEELLMGKLDAGTVGDFLVLQGRRHLDDALKRNKGAIILSAHAGSFMLPIAALSLYGYPYTQYAARGMPPQDVAQAHPDALPVNWWLEQARKTREASEDLLPARFLTLQTPVRTLYRRLADNELVALAFDGRIGNRWVRAPFLDRQALLNPGAYRMAVSTGAAIIPTLCHTPAWGPSVCVLHRPIYPDGARWQDLMRRFLTEAAEPWLRHFPEEYGTWLAHCRLRNDIDDHPLFVDHAVDDRWQAHPVLD